ncbi:MAG: DUF4834 family protein [Cyclobacteriaceae bacterium]|nr:hypothetical protein [Cyclobacteriaceae bacterium]MCB0498900.1 hypothetical protein [Cyclobacteriaceae bacterium]MCB9237586.1 hypothetical protein [Flammeovirgaceae bacterium]MCO5270312.1 DUF4834 family protein [Cyclobacteriaceae bacterium]MCW5902288.1 hypothetical protein [Cyclobacteriaceae bacterium]
MLKFLLIIAISVYLLSKFGRIFFRMGMSSSHHRPYHKPADGNVHVSGNAQKGKDKTGIKGGEYIDYEEVK